MTFRFLLVTPILTFVFAAALSEAAAPAAPDGECTAGTVRLVSYHFIVDGLATDRLQGHARPGDNFTIVVGLAGCNETATNYSMDLEVPACHSPIRTVGLDLIEGLNSANVTDDAEQALLQDLQAAMACEAFPPRWLLTAGIVALSVAAVATLGRVLVARRRRR